MKQKEVLNSIVTGLKSNRTITAILLMGSVAHGTALPTSDLDLMILGNESKFQVEMIDGVLVEFLYLTYDEAMQKLKADDMDMYHYLGSKIMYDIDGHMIYLMRMALEKYNNYKTAPQVKNALRHWLTSTKIKLTGAIENSDIVTVDYITATNSWKIMEAVWAVNNKPMPPSGRVMLDLKELALLPDKNWFSNLFSTDTKKRTDELIFLIDWVLPLLKND